MEQAEEDIEALAIKTSLSFIQFYDSSATVVIGKAMKSVEGLMFKFNDIGKDKPHGNYVDFQKNYHNIQGSFKLPHSPVTIFVSNE